MSNLIPFDNSNQPPSDLKKLGWARRKLTKEVLEAKLIRPSEAEKAAKLESLAANFGIKPKQMTNILAMNLTLLEKVLYHGDTRAYELLTNRGFGLPPALKMSKAEKNVKWTIEVIDSTKKHEATIPV